MPGLDYTKSVNGVIGVRAGARAFYAPVGEHPTVPCSDCGSPADAEFRDHGGDCLTVVHSVPPRGALGVIRRHALCNRRFSSNDVRAALDTAGVPGPKRGPAFAAAERRGWIERDGDIPSTDGPTKGHRVSVYLSHIYKPGKATR